MVLIKKKPILSKEEENAIQQPIDYKTGWTNPRFDKLYGNKQKNPWAGTERDIKNKKGARTAFLQFPTISKCKCGKEKFDWQEVCGDCYQKELKYEKK
jgi:hypothetical protein